MTKEQVLQNPQSESCQYCKGMGYFQLLLGGSETCDYCAGSGKRDIRF